MKFIMLKHPGRMWMTRSDFVSIHSRDILRSQRPNCSSARFINKACKLLNFENNALITPQSRAYDISIETVENNLREFYETERRSNKFPPRAHFIILDAFNRRLFCISLFFPMRFCTNLQVHDRERSWRLSLGDLSCAIIFYNSPQSRGAKTVSRFPAQQPSEGISE